MMLVSTCRLLNIKCSAVCSPSLSIYFEVDFNLATQKWQKRKFRIGDFKCSHLKHMEITHYDNWVIRPPLANLESTLQLDFYVECIQSKHFT